MRSGNDGAVRPLPKGTHERCAEGLGRVEILEEAVTILEKVPEQLATLTKEVAVQSARNCATRFGPAMRKPVVTCESCTRI